MPGYGQGPWGDDWGSTDREDEDMARYIAGVSNFPSGISSTVQVRIYDISSSVLVNDWTNAGIAEWPVSSTTSNYFFTAYLTDGHTVVIDWRDSPSATYTASEFVIVSSAVSQNAPIATVPGSTSNMTYLQLVNNILIRIQQQPVNTLTGATGQAKIVANFINQAQRELWTEQTNWYTLYRERKFQTTVYSANTISFNNVEPAEIIDSAAGFGDFFAGQTILVSGSEGNTGIFIVSIATNDTLTLQASDSVVAEVAGPDITITAITYPVADDWGRAFCLVDYTNNRILTEDASRAFNEADPQMQMISDPTHFAMENNFYRLYYSPAANYQMIDRYWAVPGELILDTDASALPLFCENFILEWTYMKTLEYMNKFELADRVRVNIYSSPAAKYDKGILEKAKIANSKILDKMIRFHANTPDSGMMPPKWPAHYGARYY